MIITKDTSEILNSKVNIQDTSDIDILGKLYKKYNPIRALEFGTWSGESTLACLENSNATIWTINKLFGEYRENGDSAYSNVPGDEEIISWGQKVTIYADKDGYYKTDAIGFIGRKYLDKNYGHRVCQVYCDSQDWDISNYPDSFFDTVFIDGGHQKDVVLNDTLKAFSLLRKGGVMIWHDYLPTKGVYKSSDGVVEAMKELSSWLDENFTKMVWIKGTMLLIGIKK